MVMSHEELIQRLCDEGEEAIRQNYPDPTDHRRRGGLLGFKIVRSIKDPAEFPATLEHRAAVEADLKAGDQEQYWAYRWATLQVEFVWEILQLGVKGRPEAAEADLRHAGLLGDERADEKRVAEKLSPEGEQGADGDPQRHGRGASEPSGSAG